MWRGTKSRVSGRRSKKYFRQMNPSEQQILKIWQFFWNIWMFPWCQKQTRVIQEAQRVTIVETVVQSFILLKSQHMHPAIWTREVTEVLQSVCTIYLMFINLDWLCTVHEQFFWIDFVCKIFYKQKSSARCYPRKTPWATACCILCSSMYCRELRVPVPWKVQQRYSIVFFARRTAELKYPTVLMEFQ